ncbi:MAG: NAD+ synthase [Chitinivibrionales bacterium]|nr:NAD+ synthase [Chitinivibrionales bacterium]
MKIALCQLNPRMGDVAGNTAKAMETLQRIAPQQPDLLIFPELFIQGYPPRDLLERRWFIRQGCEALEQLRGFSTRFPGTALIVGSALPNAVDGPKGLLNAAVCIYEGEQLFTQAKTLLPTYDVFDEARYFDPATEIKLFDFKGERIGVTICEDAWTDPALADTPRYAIDPVARLAEQGATLLINIAGSPYHLGKQLRRFTLMQQHARRHKRPFVFVNEVGGNDELIFDGNSLVFNAQGRLTCVLPFFEETVRVIDTAEAAAEDHLPEFDTMQSVWRALMLGLRDYVVKCGFKRVLIGLSGGIDSALTAALAAAALGPENVLGVSMPSRYSSPGSLDDAAALAKNLGCDYSVIPIETIFDAFLKTMQPAFGSRPQDITEENMQARIRGNILMALSNKSGSLLLSTGNKSEMAVGYCTLYGDMNGGLSVISDIPKTMVYKLAALVNREREIIPHSSITKAPSAELRPGQTDQDSLPPYETLDAVLELLIEKDTAIGDIIAQGYDAAMVKRIARLVSMSEYKRRQAAPGLKVTPKAFGIGRRFPIAARYGW